MAASCWDHLPSEILLTIAQWLNLADVIRLRAVCFYWALALGKNCGRPIQPFPRPSALILQPSPWLLLPIATNESTDLCKFFSMFENRSYRISSHPQTTDLHLVGSSSYGWLVAIDNLFNVCLLNPLTRQVLSLPSLTTICRNSSPIFDPSESLTSLYQLKKIILTSSPLQGGIAIAFCYLPARQNFLSLATIEDEKWSPALALNQNWDFFEDVTYSEEDGKLYAVTNQGAVYIIERTKIQSWKVVSMVSGCIDNGVLNSRRRYILFSCGNLLQVTRDIIVDYPKYSYYFKVFKFDRTCHDCHERQLLNQSNEAEIELDPRLCRYGSCWVPVEDLGDRSLFVGSSNSFTLNCVDEHSIIRNQVYFTGDMVSGWLQRSVSEAGMFNLRSKKSDCVYCFDYDYEWPPPIWFMPASSLWDEE